MIRLTSVDLPTFGRPTTATTGGTRSAGVSGGRRTSLIISVDSGGGARQGPRACAWQALARVALSAPEQPSHVRPAETVKTPSSPPLRPFAEASPIAARRSAPHTPHGWAGDGPATDLACDRPREYRAGQRVQPAHR